MENKELTKEEVKENILKEFENKGPSGQLYISDISIKYDIDYEFVEECFEELVKEEIIVEE